MKQLWAISLHLTQGSNKNSEGKHKQTQNNAECSSRWVTHSCHLIPFNKLQPHNKSIFIYFLLLFKAQDTIPTIILSATISRPQVTWSWWEVSGKDWSRHKQ